MINFPAEIRDRLLNRNKNWLAIICGSTGSGKSWSALRLAELIDPRFSIQQVCFTPQEFMKLLNSGIVKKGSCVVFDEAGVGMPSREWYSLSNRLLSYILQTFRHKNLAVIFTSPSFEFIDSQARKLFHHYFETIRIDRVGEYVILKPLAIQHNPRLAKTYYKYPEYSNCRLTRLKVNKPSEELIRAYENKKNLFSKKLGKDIEESLTPKLEEKKPQLTDEEIIKIIKKKLKGKVTVAKIRTIIPLSYNKASIIKEKFLHSQHS